MSNPKFKLLPTAGMGSREEHPTYKALLVRSGVITLDFLAETIADKASQTKADVYCTVFALAQELHHWIAQGYGVDMGPLGRFEHVVRTLGPIRNPYGIVNSQVKFGRIFYRPEASVLRSLRMLEYERDRREEVLETRDDLARQEAVMGLLNAFRSLNVSLVRMNLHVGHERARNDLETLVERGRLKRIQLEGRSFYVAANKVID